MINGFDRLPEGIKQRSITYRVQGRSEQRFVATQEEPEFLMTFWHLMWKHQTCNGLHGLQTSTVGFCSRTFTVFLAKIDFRGHTRVRTGVEDSVDRPLVSENDIRAWRSRES